MTDTQEYKDAIHDFAQRYEYDMSYQLDLLEAAPGAFKAFNRAQGTSSYRRALPLDVHYVARIAMMQADDCGGCLRLNLRMAVEAGVERELLDKLLRRPKDLPIALQDVRDHAFDVTSQTPPDPSRIERLRTAYGEDGLAELAVCFAGCRLFPTVKRALGKAAFCEVRDGDF